LLKSLVNRGLIRFEGYDVDPADKDGSAEGTVERRIRPLPDFYRRDFTSMEALKSRPQPGEARVHFVVFKARLNRLRKNPFGRREFEKANRRD
jgi:hypothetical protein